MKAHLDKQVANESLLIELGLPVACVASLMKRFDLQYGSENLSWHYHFFSSWSLSAEGKVAGAMLEIGTESGAFAKFLGDIFPSKVIHTIDLPEASEKFTSEYGRDDDATRSEYLETCSKSCRVECELCCIGFNLSIDALCSRRQRFSRHFRCNLG